MLKSLFIPRSDYFSSKFTSMKDSFSSKLGFDTYLGLFSALKSVVVGKLDFGGYIDISMWDKYLPTLQNFIRGFMYVMLGIFNIKMAIYMARGSNFITSSSNVTSSGKEGL